MRIVPIAAIVLGLALPASGMGQPPEAPEPMEKDPVTTDAEDTCNSAEYTHLIGQPGSAAEALELDRPARVIPVGAAVTMDFRLERINFELDGAGNVARIYCG